MDPKSRFLSALALASLSTTLVYPETANAFPKAKLYDLCKQGNEEACSLFLRTFPNSEEAHDVMCCVVDAIIQRIADLDTDVDPDTYTFPPPYTPPPGPDRWEPGCELSPGGYCTSDDPDTIYY